MLRPYKGFACSFFSTSNPGPRSGSHDDASHRRGSFTRNHHATHAHLILFSSGISSPRSLSSAPAALGQSRISRRAAGGIECHVQPGPSFRSSRWPVYSHSPFPPARKKSLSLKQPPHPLRKPPNRLQQSPPTSRHQTPSSPPATT